jgi:hypothetical protein
MSINTGDSVVIIKSVDHDYINKKAEVLHFNKLNNKCTLYIRSIPIRDKQYLKTSVFNLRKIPRQPKIYSNHYQYLYTLDDLDNKILNNTLNFYRLLIKYQECGLSNNTSETHKIHKTIIDTIIDPQKLIEPRLQTTEDGETLLDCVFIFDCIPEFLRIYILRMLLDLGAGSSDSIPAQVFNGTSQAPRAEGVYSKLNLFKSTILTFSSYNLVPVLKMILNYGINRDDAIQNLDDLYTSDVITNETRKRVIDVLLTKEEKHNCNICSDCELSYQIQCCMTNYNDNRICIDCYNNLYESFKPCPFCRQTIGGLVTPKIRRVYNNMNIV